MEGKKEILLNEYPKIISYDCTKIILNQMKETICKIKIGEKQGTGLFCKIPFPNINNMLPVFITNNHVITKDLLYKKDEKISIYIENESDIKQIELNNRIKYTNEEYDITILGITENDEINNYLELDSIIIDDILNKKEKNNKYIDQTIYAIQYPEGELSVSFGILKNIYDDKKYNFNHKCITKDGSSGSPILCINNNKLIGIHKEGYSNKFNKGTFLNYPIKEFIKQNFSSIKKNEIKNEEKDKIYDLNEKLLINFNNKYNLNIKNEKVDLLDLNLKYIENEGLRDLIKINFKELKKLLLSVNNISNI